MSMGCNWKMGMKFKRALVGYEDGEVKKLIESMNENFEKTLMKLEEEFISASEETRALNIKIQALEREIEAWKQREEEMRRILFDTHLNNSRSVYNTLVETEQVEKNRLEAALSYEKEYAGLKKTVKRLINELRSKVEEYRFRLGAAEYGEGDGGIEE